MDTTFIDELASAAPTPGGGGASAYCGALAAALGSMVGNLTVGKKAYASVEETIAASLGRLGALRAELIALVDADAEVFAPLAAAYRMPKESLGEQQAKEAALQDALIGATEVPLAIMRTCSDVLHEVQVMADDGSRMAVSDAGAAAVFAKAALQGASLNVRINIASLADVERAAAYRREMDELLAAGCAQADGIYQSVVERL